MSTDFLTEPPGLILLGITILFLLAAGLILLKRPSWLLLIFTAITLPLPVQVYAYQTGKLYISHLLFALMAGFVVFYLVRGDLKIDLRQVSKVDFIYLIVLGFAVISVLNSYLQIGPVEKLNRGIIYQAVAVLLMSTGLIMVWIVRAFVATENQARSLVMVMTGVALFGATQSLIFWARNGLPLFFSDYWKNILVQAALAGEILNVYNWNLFLAFLFPVIFFQFIRSTNRKIRMWLIIVLLILGLGILAESFVDTWLLIFVALLVGIPWYPRLIKKVSIGLILVIPIPLGVLSAAILGERVLSFTRRFELINLGINIWKQHPLLGVGPGNYNLYMLENVPPYYFVQFNRLGLNTFHNFYIQVLVETGLLGLILTLVLMFVVGRQIFAVVRRLPNGYLKNFTIGVFTSYIGLFFALVSGESFYLMMGIGGLEFFLGNSYIWVLLGLAMIADKLTPRPALLPDAKST